jgi:hypothetical protein
MAACIGSFIHPKNLSVNLFDMETQLVESPNYPKLICENCLHVNQLDFDPRKKTALLDRFLCSECLENAYWTNYYRPGELAVPANFGLRSFERELVRTGLVRLIDLQYAK